MYKKSVLLFFISVLTFLLAGTAFAVPAAPDIFEIEQPDGNSFKVMKKGDEWDNRVETADGYAVKKGSDGFWYYISRFDNDRPVMSSRRAHEKAKKGLKKHIRKAGKFRKRPDKEISGGAAVNTAPSVYTAAESGLQLPAELQPALAPAAFNGAVLFILAEFTDVSGTYSEASFAAFINNNISDYFDKASYGVVTLSPANESSGTANNGVVNWVNVGYKHPNNTNKQQLARDAIVAADPFVDYSAYDNDGDGYVDADELAIVVIAAGYECAYGSYTPCMWGHRSSLGSVGPPVLDGVTVGDYHGSRGGYAEFGERHGSHQATMGIMVHELGHLVFNLPDLYDTDGSSEGIGAYGVMGGGSWGRTSLDTYSGETPVLPCAWSRYSLGWIDGTEGTGSVSITAAGSSSADISNTAFKLLTNSASEYFWVENRQSVGYDAGLYRWLGAGFGGLAIWHIDKNTISGKIGLNTINNSECYPGGPSCVSDHFGIAIEQADGNWDIEKNNNRGNSTDLWYSGNQTAFDSLSTPDSNLYDGTSSGVSISNISAPGEIMTATLTSPAVTVFEDRFESGLLGAEWSTNSTNEGRILITRNNSPYTGKYHVTMDDSVAGSAFSLNELILTLDLTSGTGVKLTFFQMEIGDEDHPMPASFTGSNNSEGVAISADGNIWYRVVDLGIAKSAWDYTMFEVDLDAAIASAGISYNSTFKIKFQQYDNYPINYDGFAFDQIEVSADPLTCTDNDGDGYGDPGDASCLNGSQADCDDNDILEFPGQLWYEDFDADLYSSGNSAVQCLRPANYYVEAELTATSGDCNDNNTNEYPGQTWYADIDGDNYSDGSTLSQCLRPTDYYVNSELTANSGDCDDNDVNIYPGGPPVRVVGGATVYYTLLQDAYNLAADGDAIQCQATALTGDLNVDRNISVTLQGGYDCGYSAVTGSTTLNGTITINDGTMTAGDFIAQ